MGENIIRTRGTIGCQKFGTYGGYTVQGFHYCNERQSIGWHIQSWPGGDPVHSFWFADNEFHALRIGTKHQYSNQIEIEIYGPKQISPEERKAILEAIDEWNKEISESV